MMLDLKLKRTGRISVSGKKISIEGFEANGATCREVGALALI